MEGIHKKIGDSEIAQQSFQISIVSDRNTTSMSLNPYSYHQDLNEMNECHHPSAMFIGRRRDPPVCSLSLMHASSLDVSGGDRCFQIYTKRPLAGRIPNSTSLPPSNLYRYVSFHLCFTVFPEIRLLKLSEFPLSPVQK